MKWISSQPAADYYSWQVEVYINNFIMNGVSPNDIHVLFSTTNGFIPESIKILQKSYPYIVFYFYEDSRENKEYIPAIYFNAVKQHIKKYFELENETILFHDSDTILTKPIAFNNLLKGKEWYFSDTKSYINYDYILSKGKDVYDRMIDIVGIHPLIPKICNSQSGGAQHLIKNSTYEFWDKVESDSIKLYKMFCDTEHLYIKKHEVDYPIQKWTAGMWSLLWNAWYFGNEVKIASEMNFCWATDNIDMWDVTQFMHNAGVTEDRAGLFYKGGYTNTLPYNKSLNINERKCSYEYYKWIQKVEKISALTN